MALGMREAGFVHRLLVEWWHPAARVLRHNALLHDDLWPLDAVQERDVRGLSAPADLGDEPALVAGGPPCQPFSLAGAHAGDSDERNMFPAALDIVRATRPKLVVFENVPGLLRGSFSPYLSYVKDQLARPSVAPRDGELWYEHLRRIENVSGPPEYVVVQQQIDAADLGVPQSRRRVFVVGIRTDLVGVDEWPGVKMSHSLDALLYDQFVTGAYWTGHNLRQRVPSPRLRGRIDRLRSEPPPAELPWVTLRDLLRGVPRPLSRPNAAWPDHVFIPGARIYKSHTGSPLDLPSKTIKAGVHGVSGGEAMIRNLNGDVRYLTVREAALAQGFPRAYEFPGPRSRVMGVIGNAVAVQVAAAVGSSLRSYAAI